MAASLLLEGIRRVSSSEIAITYVGSSGPGAQGHTRKLAYAMSGYWSFLRALKHGANIVHIHTASGADFWRNAPYVLCARLLRVRCILHVHPAWSYARFVLSGCWLWRRLKLSVLSTASSFVVPSAAAQMRLLRLLPGRQVDVLPNPIRCSEFSTKELADRSELVVFLGWVTPAKGVLDLIEATADLIKERPSIQVVLCGPYCSEAVRSTIADRGLADVVTIREWVSGQAKTELLASARVLALPSYTEGFPVVLLEGLAAGLPCVATRVGGIPEIIQDGKYGILVEPGDTRALARALRTLLLDEDMWTQMSVAAREASLQYDISTVVNNLVDIYRLEPAAGAV